MTALVMLENREGVLPMVFLTLVLGACSPEANIGRFTTTADQIRSLQSVPAVLLESFRVCFGRSSTFDRWERYLLGLLADLKRKSIKPIALAAGAKVRTLQEFLSAFEWDHERVNKLLQQRAMDKHGSEAGIAGQAAHASKRVDNVCRYGPAFRDRDWTRVHIKDTTRGPAVWELKAPRVWLADASQEPSKPTDRQYWLIVARNPSSGEYKYFVSNASAQATLGCRNGGVSKRGRS